MTEAGEEDDLEPTGSPDQKASAIGTLVTSDTQRAPLHLEEEAQGGRVRGGAGGGGGAAQRGPARRHVVPLRGESGEGREGVRGREIERDNNITIATFIGKQIL